MSPYAELLEASPICAVNLIFLILLEGNVVINPSRSAFSFVLFCGSISPAVPVCPKTCPLYKAKAAKHHGATSLFFFGLVVALILL